MLRPGLGVLSCGLLPHRLWDPWGSGGQEEAKCSGDEAGAGQCWHRPLAWRGTARWAALLTPSLCIQGQGDTASIAALPGPARGAPQPFWRGGRPAAVYNRAQLHPVGGRGRRAPRPHARGLVPINYHPSMSPCPLGAAPRPCRGARPVDTGRWPRAACSCPRSHAAVISGDVDTGEPSPSRRAPRC